MSMRTPAAFRRWWPALRACAAAALLGALGWQVGFGAFADGVRAVSPGAALAALGIGAVTTVASALRWRVVARRLGLPLGARTAIADYYGSLVLNAVLPAGVLGDVHRAVAHGARVGALGRGVRAVVWERGVGLAVLAVAGAGLVAAHPVLPGLLGPWGLACAVAAVLVAAAALRRVRDDVRLLGFAGLLSAVGLSAVAVAGYVGLFAVAASSAGVRAPGPDIVVLAVAALLVMSVPLSVGGWGPREAFLAVAFGAVGLGAADGLRTAVAYGVLAAVSAAPGLAVLAVRLGQRRQVRPERARQVCQDGLALGGAAQ